MTAVLVDKLPWGRFALIECSSYSDYPRQGYDFVFRVSLSAG